MEPKRRLFGEKVVLFIILLMVLFADNKGFCGYSTYDIKIPSSPNPVGSGARALAMGGAFIAIADDATAASWNPGGLAQLEHPEFSAVGYAFHRVEDIMFGQAPEANGAQAAEKSRLNYLSFAFPLELLGRNVVVSANYQNLYDFGREWDFNIRDKRFSETTQYIHKSEGSLSAFGLAGCVEITHRLSLGVTINLWRNGFNKNEWEEEWLSVGTGLDEQGVYRFFSNNRDRYSLRGINANLGMLWNMWQREEKLLSLGIVIKTPFKADLDHEHSFHGWLLRGDESHGNIYHHFGNYVEELKMPLSLGVGAAYRHSDAFTISFDIYRTEWGDFIRTDESGMESYPVTGKQVGESEKPDPTHQIRMGMEYRFYKKMPVINILGGLFYDPAPSEGGPDTIFGFSAGAGAKWHGLHVGMAYQYRHGDGIAGYFLKHRDFSMDMREHTIYLSTIIYF